MNANLEFGEALLRLHSKASKWLGGGSVAEVAAWQDQAKVLQVEISRETDKKKRKEIAGSLRGLRWLLRNSDIGLTEGYANLIFAFGLARVGARTESASLEAATAPIFKTDDAAHQLAFRAFSYRIDQARNGGPCDAPLPPEFLTLPQEYEQGELEDRLARYKFDRLRSGVLILEPADDVDPYRFWAHGLARTGIDRELGSLYEATDPNELERQTRKFLEKYENAHDKLKTLGVALNLFPCLPTDFSRFVLETTRGLLESLTPLGELRNRERERSELAILEIAAHRAADGSDTALLQCVIGALFQVLDAQEGEDVFCVLPILVGRCLQSLQRLCSFGWSLLSSDIGCLPCLRWREVARIVAGFAWHLQGKNSTLSTP